MNFFQRLFRPQHPPEPIWTVPPPEPVDSFRLRGVRLEVEVVLEKLRQRQIEEELRQRERERKWEEARRRREAEEAAARAAGKPIPSRVMFERIGDDDIMAELRAAVAKEYGRRADPDAFARFLRQAVRKVYGDNPVPFYSAAGLDRSTYSKLITHPDRHPAKDTMLAMAAALKMEVPAVEEFLRMAGYALSDSIPSDIVWRVCFAHGVHNLPQIRELLAEFDPRKKNTPSAT